MLITKVKEKRKENLCLTTVSVDKRPRECGREIYLNNIV